MDPRFTIHCLPARKCSEVCSTGTIRLLDVADKSFVQVGHAEWVKKNSIVISDQQQCDNCAHQCPTRAIHFIPADANHLDELKSPLPV